MNASKFDELCHSQWSSPRSSSHYQTQILNGHNRNLRACMNPRYFKYILKYPGTIYLQNGENELVVRHKILVWTYVEYCQRKLQHTQELVLLFNVKSKPQHSKTTKLCTLILYLITVNKMNKHSIIIVRNWNLSAPESFWAVVGKLQKPSESDLK